MTLGVQFGTHSVEALLWVAETVEEGVYAAGSLRRTTEGLAFVLDNPPLRVGRFTSVVLRVNGDAVPAGRVRLRVGEGSSWRTAASIDAVAPLDLGPGDRLEFGLLGVFGQGAASITVRLELRTPAIPPLVWFEFDERPLEVSLRP